MTASLSVALCLPVLLKYLFAFIVNTFMRMLLLLLLAFAHANYFVVICIAKIYLRKIPQITAITARAEARLGSHTALSSVERQLCVCLSIYMRVVSIVCYKLGTNLIPARQPTNGARPAGSHLHNVDSVASAWPKGPL